MRGRAYFAVNIAGSRRLHVSVGQKLDQRPNFGQLDLFSQSVHLAGDGRRVPGGEIDRRDLLEIALASEDRDSYGEVDRR